MSNELRTTQQFDLTPRNLEEAFKFADMLANSSYVPKDFIGKPGNIMVAMQWGMELGLKPMQAMQNIAVINGRPSIWGDAMLALVQASPHYEWHQETEEATQGTCTVKRRGQEPHTAVFTMDDAKKAGLLGKQGPWGSYPQRMMKLRARGFALRDVFADVLKGIISTEESQDYPRKEIDITPHAKEPVVLEKKLEAYPQENFDKNLSSWHKLINDGKKTADEIIFTISSKALLSDSQKELIKGGNYEVIEHKQPVLEEVIETGFTFAQVADAMRKAKTLSKLDDAADLVGEVSNEQHREELRDLYQQRLEELQAL